MNKTFPWIYRPGVLVKVDKQHFGVITGISKSSWFKFAKSYWARLSEYRRAAFTRFIIALD
jgi:hypothetical protein